MNANISQNNGIVKCSVTQGCVRASMPLCKGETLMFKVVSSSGDSGDPSAYAKGYTDTGGFSCPTTSSQWFEFSVANMNGYTAYVELNGAQVGVEIKIKKRDGTYINSFTCINNVSN